MATEDRIKLMENRLRTAGWEEAEGYAGPIWWAPNLAVMVYPNEAAEWEFIGEDEVSAVVDGVVGIGDALDIALACFEEQLHERRAS